MSNKLNELQNGLSIIELEDRLETVQVALGTDLPISFRCDRKNCDCESVE